MLSGIGVSGVIIIAVVALLLFGPTKLPQLGRAFGTTIKEFRQGTKGLLEEDTVEKQKSE
ncbi:MULTISPECIES: twin-arginine translocase TatA/TatE family subunit [Paenibacillus]|uniref:Sec-independent protein translocase protein TatA n=1 Tax=Paenibacillus anseongense TaxID=2682845 RepID=A0ABW9ULM9_9BACL|nr:MULTISPECIES: twin-arginine translocase TatA/TatE family subunit [Paenibacillus]MBA2941311.1 twin-arginine translocase TatA/TatE family subunit [Paenibacillus sp. CGMCC 1.16610]MVQ40130.1 twin-arginine translocase TatA/TatE family subunit [Paenibacillus anseongense]